MTSASFSIDGTTVPAAVSVAYGASVAFALLSTTGVNTIAWTIAGSSKSTYTNSTITPAGVPRGASATCGRRPARVRGPRPSEKPAARLRRAVRISGRRARLACESISFPLSLYLKDRTPVAPPKPRYLIFSPPDVDLAPLERAEGSFSVVVAGPTLKEAFSGFDATVVLAGAFESTTVDVFSSAKRLRYDSSQLDRRNLEAETALQAGKAVVFLVPPIEPGNPVTDLFRRVMHRLGVPWQSIRIAVPTYAVKAREFEKYCRTYGSASASFSLYAQPDARILAEVDGRNPVAFTVGNVFCLPCHAPTSAQDLTGMALVALESVAQYRYNQSNEVPIWVDDLPIGRENHVREETENARTNLLELEKTLSEYRDTKAILCFKGDPLVDRIQAILESRFELDVRRDDVRIEDLTLVDQDGSIFAVVEVKGVNRNFQRADINQVDGHRERLGLPSSVPGLLIMNTIASANCLNDKLQEPHPDLVKKAAQDNVALLRTLDLLYAVDLLEKQAIVPAAFRAALFSGGGWLRVLDGKLITETAQGHAGA